MCRWSRRKKTREEKLHVDYPSVTSTVQQAFLSSKFAEPKHARHTHTFVRLEQSVVSPSQWRLHRSTLLLNLFFTFGKRPQRLPSVSGVCIVSVNERVSSISSSSCLARLLNRKNHKQEVILLYFFCPPTTRFRLLAGNSTPHTHTKTVIVRLIALKIKASFVQTSKKIVHLQANFCPIVLMCFSPDRLPFTHYVYCKNQ